MFLEFSKAHALMNRHTVTDYVQVKTPKVDQAFALRILNPSVPNVPFSGHSPIENLDAGWHFPNFQWDMFLEDSESFPHTFAGDTATDWK
jgi:hypothetical protein